MEKNDFLTICCPVPFAKADSAQWNASVLPASADSPVVVLVDPDFSGKPRPADEIRAAFSGDPELAVFCVESVANDSSVPLTAEVAAFLPFVAPLAAVAFRRSAPLGELPDVRDPIRGWLMQAAENGLRQRRLALPADNELTAFDDRLPMLRPAEPGREWGWLRDRIERLDLQTLLSRIRSEDDATAFRAGLLQMNDFLDASHEHSQSIEGEGRNRAGDYWHAVMHRREPDYSNAKYWFRRVGSHPIFVELASRAAALLGAFQQVSREWRGRLLPGGRFDPVAFVDLCQACPNSETDDLSRFARRLQWIEMQLLLEQTRKDVES
jgi:hypothetical protein